MQTIRKSMLLLAPVLLLLGSCDKKEKEVTPTLDNEAITTVTMQLTNKANAAEVVEATIDKLNTATADFSKSILNLKANTAYTGRILLADKSKTPTVDVSKEVKEEQNDHLFIYAPASGLNLTLTRTDRDTNPAPGPYPVGLAFEVVTTGASTGKLNVVLRHQPKTKNGTPTPGTTDLDTNFDVIIK